MATDAFRRERYLGEKCNFRREGYGTYVYENQFFRYEGEWKNGKKHGHGKLLMKDGTYYEGEFVDGEISGHGFKFFASNNNKYTGQFLNGEMHGQGVMQYSSGGIYEGQWVRNRKQGFGILRTSPGEVYEGSFDDLRHGEGTQTYKNGDRYEGYWVMDQRQGHGELYCADGSYYVGQFMISMFHGKGRFQHVSGMVYEGQWLNGFPYRMPTKMVIIAEESPLVIIQGQTFKIAVKCQDDDDNDVVEDKGRELQLMAGFRHIPPKQGSILFDMIEDVEEKPIPTPFGYDVVAYPLTDQLADEEVVEEEKGDSKGKKEEDGDEKQEGGEGEAEFADGHLLDEEGEGIKPAGGVDGTKPAVGVEGTLEINNPEGMQQHFASDPPSPTHELGPDSSNFSIDNRTVSPSVANPLHPMVPTQRTDCGYAEWTNVQLCPPPPLYRPFVALDEEKKAKKKQAAKDKSGMQQQQQIAADSGSVSSAGRASRKKSHGHRKSSVSIDPKEPKDVELHKLGKQSFATEYSPLSPIEGDDESEKGSRSASGVQSEAESASSSRAQSDKKGSVIQGPSGNESSNVFDEKFARTAGKKRKLKLKGRDSVEITARSVAMPGEYVLIVNDVTTPPFLGKRLDPAFYLLKVQKLKKALVKKPNAAIPEDREYKRWDTQRHIVQAMNQSRIYSNTLNN